MSSMLNARVPDELAEDIDTEAERLGFETRSDYLRHLIDRRGELVDEVEVRTHDLAAVLEEVDTALEDVEQIVEEIERLAAGNGVEPTETAAVDRVSDVTELDIPGRGETLAARRDALGAIHDRLRERGEATKDELLEVVDPDAVGYASADSFWSNVIAGEDTLSRLPGVVSPGSGHGATWRYEGDDES